MSVGVYQHTEALNMQIKRLLDDREVYAGIDCLMLRGAPIRF